jgi:hypothetical protein
MKLFGRALEHSSEMHLAQSPVIAKGANHVKSEKCSKKAGGCTVYGRWCIACPCGNGSPCSGGRSTRAGRNSPGCNCTGCNCTGVDNCYSNYTGCYGNNRYGHYHNDYGSYTGRCNSGSIGTGSCSTWRD